MAFKNNRRKKPFPSHQRDDKKAVPVYNKKINDSKLGREQVRLNRFIANAGICSRREADQLILAGEIRVNGKIVRELGTRILATDTVTYQGRKLKNERPIYVLLNKPKGFITSTSDPQGRKTVMELVKNACEERIYPVGRLDRDTTGLLLFTNDGHLARRLSHPSTNIRKLYQVELNKPVAKNDFIQISEGLMLEDGKAIVDNLAYVNDEKTILGIELHSGKNRIVRRIFEKLEYEVKKLDRVMYSGLTKKNLARGKWRFLSEKEVVRLKHFK